MATKNRSITSFFKPISKSVSSPASSSPDPPSPGSLGNSPAKSVIANNGTAEEILSPSFISQSPRTPSTSQPQLRNPVRALPFSPKVRRVSKSPSTSASAAPHLDPTVSVDGDVDRLSHGSGSSVWTGTPSSHNRVILKPKSRSQSPFLAPPSSPLISSSPPSLPDVKQKVSIDAEIPGSDDDDSDSFLWDDPLMPTGQTKPMASMRSPKRRDPCVTPKAKRVAVSSYLSPPVYRPTHRFDMKTLLNHAEKDKATEESSKRVALIKLEEEEQETSIMDASPNTKRHQFVNFAAVGEDDEAAKQKMIRAMERTETGATRTRWYFFKTETDNPISTEAPFPKQSAKGPWALLSGTVKSRNQHIMSGLPYNMASRRRLPDEIFLWLMSALHAAESAALQEEYRKLIEVCPDQIDDIMTVECLQNMFQKLGAGDHLTTAKQRAVREVENAYDGKDWTILRVHLRLFSDISSSLAVPSLVYLVKMLLRMGVDKMVIENPDVLVDYQGAMTSLIASVSLDSWDDFCMEVCSFLCDGFEKASFRVQPLVVMPIGSRRVHDLRRRLAIAFLMKSPELAKNYPDEIFTLERAIERLKDSEFNINRRTDYVDLRAYILLLDMAIDNGSYQPEGSTPADEKVFDASVDRLAKRLQTIWRSINDAGTAYMSRTEAKSVLERVQHRLTYSVRRRPPAKQSLFDIPEREDPSAPKQTNLWKWYQKPRKPVVVDLSDDGEGETFLSAVDGL